MEAAMPVFASVASAAIGAIGASKAAKAQTKAANSQIELQQGIYEDQKALFDPFRTSGLNALGAYNSELGLGPAPMIGGTPLDITTVPGTMPAAGTNALGGFSLARGNQDRRNYTPGSTPAPQASPTTYQVGGKTFYSLEEAQAYANANKTGGQAYGGFRQTPGYQFALDQGINAIDRSAASSGGLFSGETMKAAQSYGQGLQNQQYDNYLNRLSGLVANGQNAVNGAAAAGQNYATGASNALGSIGNAQAAGAIGVGNALNNGLSNGIGIWQYQKGLNNPANNYGVNPANPASFGIGLGGSGF